MADKKRVLITGAAGYIGSFLRKAWINNYDLVLTDQKEISEPESANVIFADIRDVESMKRACNGVHTVVHLAANPSSRSDFDTIVLPINIIGTHSVFRAAAEMGVKRVVFASSVHAVGGYPPDVQVKWDMPVRPCCEYGASKCYGEALGRYFSDAKGLSVIAVRIGGVHGHEQDDNAHDPKMADILVSEEDLTQLMTKCVDAPDTLRFAIVHGLSDNRIKRLDISHTREILGYDPKDEVGEEIKTGIPDTVPLYHL
ncbi:MAG: NAD-dependent epimerase/dehydratase family protein [Armatimonadota bacterium]